MYWWHALRKFLENKNLGKEAKKKKEGKILELKEKEW